MNDPEVQFDRFLGTFLDTCLLVTLRKNYYFVLNFLTTILLRFENIFYAFIINKTCLERNTFKKLRMIFNTRYKLVIIFTKFALMIYIFHKRSELAAHELGSGAYVSI